MIRQHAPVAALALIAAGAYGHLVLQTKFQLLDLAPGSEVITSPLTFSTDLAPLIRAGLVPVFVDVEPDTFNVDVFLTIAYQDVSDPADRYTQGGIDDFTRVTERPKIEDTSSAPSIST